MREAWLNQATRTTTSVDSDHPQLNITGLEVFSIGFYPTSRPDE